MSSPTDPLANAVETFSAPIESILIALGQGIAQAQQALDANSIKVQESIDSDPVLSQYGLQATWYQFPTVNMQLKMSLSIAENQTQSSSSSPQVASRVAASPIVARQFHIIAQPLSASFQSNFNYDAQAATQINLTMVPVPAPKTASAVNSPPSMTQAAVLKVALASGAPFVTSTNAQGATVDSAGNVYVMLTNFNPTSRVWYVIQYAPSNASIQAISVAVDDGTQTARILSTGT